MNAFTVIYGRKQPHARQQRFRWDHCTRTLGYGVPHCGKLLKVL
jgi:hypothetical protein